MNDSANIELHTLQRFDQLIGRFVVGGRETPRGGSGVEPNAVAEIPRERNRPAHSFVPVFFVCFKEEFLFKNKKF